MTSNDQYLKNLQDKYGDEESSVLPRKKRTEQGSEPKNRKKETNNYIDPKAFEDSNKKQGKGKRAKSGNPKVQNKLFKSLEL